ncbi:bifunctional lysylphosphatidylglycerol flippase/synthetase MprF [Clostridium tertium]|uniref:bifunctional lysylphosphatidylglycerol flippase/synthetase MprF n=1 Tax=Clostridium tertium TaxID=1559 RepID=UPI0035634BA0
MKDKINKKFFTMIQVIFVIVIIFIACRELFKIVISMDKNLFITYSNNLTFTNVFIIIILGLISYLPLSFYDLIINGVLNIKLPKKRIYKYSWISSSISNVVGFAGVTAIFFKKYFYNNYIDDSSKLYKEGTRVVGLNLSGFSLVCLIYSFWNLLINKNFDKVFWVSLIIGLYLPMILFISTYNMIKSRDKKTYMVNIEIILTSILEWITTIILIYGLMIILEIKISFSQFAPIYVSAIIVAIISMVPGGVGTFDLTLILGLQKFNIPSEKVILLIILYRVSYYIIPFFIGVSLYISDLYIKINSSTRELISRINSKITHYILFITLFISGLSLVFGYDIYLDKYFPNKEIVFNMNIVEFSINISIILGFMIIVLSTLIHTESKGIYYTLIFILSILTALAFTNKYNYFEYIYLTINWILIILSKKRFYKQGFIYTIKNLIRSIFVILSIFIINLIITYSTVKYYISLKITDINYIPVETIKSFYNPIIKSIFIGGTISILLIIFIFSRNKYNKFPKEYLDKEQVNNIISKYGGTNVAHYIYLNDKYVYVNNKEDVVFQYEISSDKIIVLGEPIGNEESFFEAIEEFLDLTDLYGYTVAFTGIGDEIMPILRDLGYEFMKIGRDAIVDLNKFSLAGNKNKSNRQAINRIDKAGYKFSIINPPYTDELFNTLKEISDEWLHGKKEKGFCIGFLDKDYIEMDKLAIVRDNEDNIKGFATIMPMYDNETLSVDLMRFKKIELNGLMDYMFANIFEYCKENGYKYFNLGLVPLAEVGNNRHSFFIEKVAYQIFLHGNYFYSFSGLKKFKDKYVSNWESRYIAYKKGTSIIITIIQLTNIINKERKEEII